MPTIRETILAALHARLSALTPEYRGADIRCGLNERLGCGTNRILASAAIADAAFLCICSTPIAAPRCESSKRLFAGISFSQNRGYALVRTGRTIDTRGKAPGRLSALKVDTKWFAAAAKDVSTATAE